MEVIKFPIQQQNTFKTTDARYSSSFLMPPIPSALPTKETTFETFILEKPNADDSVKIVEFSMPSSTED